eukprot:RCo033433
MTTVHPGLNAGGGDIILNAKISKKLKRMYCCSCTCSGDETFNHTYFIVHNNRIEFNQPQPKCCQTMDYVNVIFMDRDIMENVEKAGCCWGCIFCPTCCNCCGEGIILHSNASTGCNPCCCCKKDQALALPAGDPPRCCLCLPRVCNCVQTPRPIDCCCRKGLIIVGFENATELVGAIKVAKTGRPSAATMQ